MHPLLARGERLALYLALWMIAGALLAALLAGEGGLRVRSAALLGFPLAAAYAFVCLSAWYICRATPLTTMVRVRAPSPPKSAGFMPRFVRGAPRARAD